MHCLRGDPIAPHKDLVFPQVISTEGHLSSTRQCCIGAHQFRDLCSILQFYCSALYVWAVIVLLAYRSRSTGPQAREASLSLQ